MSTSSRFEEMPKQLRERLATMAGLNTYSGRKSSSSLRERRTVLMTLFCMTILCFFQQAIFGTKDTNDFADWLPRNLVVKAAPGTFYIGDNDPVGCFTRGSAMDFDQITESSLNVVVGGTTNSKSLLLGKPVNSCTSRPIPFLMKYQDGVKVWEKYFTHDVYNLAQNENDANIFGDVTAVHYPK
jgi:hypothetical protein